MEVNQTGMELPEQISRDKPYFSGPIPFLLVLALALLGTFAAAFLTYRHVLLASQTGGVGESFLCRAYGKISCDGVLSTEYAVILDVFPSAVLGLMGFAFALWCTINGLVNPRLRKIALIWLTIYFCVAVSFSFYFIYLMLFEVENVCPWCIVVHAVNFISFFLLVVLCIRHRADFPLPEVSTLGERVYFLIGGVLLSLLVFLAAGMAEKTLGYIDAEDRYRDLADNWAVQRALLEATPSVNVPISAEDPTLGSPDGPYAIIVFTDFACPACAKLDGWLRVLIAKNQRVLRLVYKNYPLSTDCNDQIVGNLHPMACQAARAAHAAFMLGGNQVFSKYVDLLFQHQGRFRKEPWWEFAKQIGLDAGRFGEQLKAGSSADKKVLQDLKLAHELRIGGTPQIIFESKMISDRFRGPELVNLLQDLIRSRHPEHRSLVLNGPG